MKKHILKITMLTMTLGVAVYAGAQPLALHVLYNLRMEEYHVVSEEVESRLTPYDKVILMPTMINEYHDEKIYSNGHYDEVIDVTYPLGKVEAWQKAPDRIELNNYEVKSYEQSVLLNTTPTGNLPPPHPSEYASNYMVVEPFSLPLPANMVDSLIYHGFTLLANDGNVLEVVSDTFRYFCSLDNKYEEYTRIENGIPVELESYSYTNGDHGQWFYQTRMSRKLIMRDTNCIEKVSIQNYSNFQRIFLDPTLIPGGDPEMVNTSEKMSEFNDQVNPQNNIMLRAANSNEGIVLYLKEAEPLNIRIMDMHGKIILDNITIYPGKNNIQDTHKMSWGIYLLVDKSGQNKTQKFLYYQK